MGEMIRNDPLNELRTLLDLWRRPFDVPTLFRRELPEALESLRVDVYEANDNLVVKAAIPGVQRDYIKIDVTHGILHIAAETQDEKNIEDKDCYLHEYSHRKISRSLRLPSDVQFNKAHAMYRDGIPKIEMPKAKEAKPHSVKVAIN